MAETELETVVSVEGHSIWASHPQLLCRWCMHSTGHLAWLVSRLCGHAQPLGAFLPGVHPSLVCLGQGERSLVLGLGTQSVSLPC